jgi:ketosteroid isomerase-like protein
MADARTRSAQAALMATAEETEQAFYEALQQGDVDRLMSVWAEDEEVACVHPNGPRLVGPGAIRAAFETVLSNGGMAITPVSTRRMETATCAVHHVLEKVQAVTSEGLQTAYVLATNVFVRSELGWRMVAHHASPGQADQMLEMVEAGPVLH